MKWIFNDNYEDYQQVEEFYKYFEKLYNEITRVGDFAYNALFKGKLGIEDEKQEDIAIYLLQQSKIEKSRREKINNLLKDGFKQIERGEGTLKYQNIIQVGTDYSNDSTKEFNNGRIVFKEGRIYAIMPKGSKRRGYLVYGDRLIFAK